MITTGDRPEQILAREGHLGSHSAPLGAPLPMPSTRRMSTLDMGLCQRGWLRLVASLMIPVCSATFSYVSGSSDSQLEPWLDRLGIGRLDWRLPSMP